MVDGSAHSVAPKELGPAANKNDTKYWFPGGAASGTMTYAQIFLRYYDANGNVCSF